jgi:alkaline phosphatase D
LIPGLYFAYTATIPVAPRLSKPSPPSSSPSDAKESESTPPTPQNEANHCAPQPPQAASNNRDVPWELLFSLPTTRLTSILTWSINTALILLAADFVFTPVVDSAADVTFTRVGAVYPDAAKIVVRYPISDANVTDRDVLILWRPATAAAAEPWTDGPIVHLQPESDWTNTTKLANLWPSTEYECAYASDSCLWFMAG